MNSGGGGGGKGGVGNRLAPGGVVPSSRASSVGGAGGGGGGVGPGGLPRPGHPKRPSVSFEVPEKDTKSFLSHPSSGRGGGEVVKKDVVKKDVSKDPEVQRRDRRRGEAKAAIEV